MLVPQLLQLGPQQDVLLSLCGGQAQRSGGVAAGTALGDTRVGHTLGKAPGKQSGLAHQTPENTPSHLAWGAGEAADEGVPSKCSLQMVFHVMGPSARCGGGGGVGGVEKVGNKTKGGSAEETPAQRKETGRKMCQNICRDGPSGVVIMILK